MKTLGYVCLFAVLLIDCRAVEQENLQLALRERHVPLKELEVKVASFGDYLSFIVDLRCNFGGMLNKK